MSPLYILPSFQAALDTFVPTKLQQITCASHLSRPLHIVDGA
jgi:hypothetical protein